MAGGFLRSTLYQILNCGFFALVSTIMVLSGTSKTFTGKTSVHFSPVSA